MNQGSIVTGAEANTLPSGSAIVCVSTPTGPQPVNPSALVRHPLGWVGAEDRCLHSLEPLHPAARFYILYTGDPS